MAVKAVALLGCSGTGKTTLIEKIPRTGKPGIPRWAIEHDTHRFEITHPGKESHRLA